MPNPFVDYLNSLNSADANATGALAEVQVTSPYYDRVFVKRTLREFVVSPSSQPRTIILTGHAGDGKTSLLAQILKEIDCLSAGQSLKKSDIVESPKGMTVVYVKDMSELTKDEQVDLLRVALEAPEKGMWAILVSNTGPLISTVQRFLDLSDEESGTAVMALLDQMDTNSYEPVTIGNYPCYVFNMARIDNVHMAPKILEKMVQGDLWSDCEACTFSGKCPIRGNQQSVLQALERVSSFINAFYRYLQEYDKRLTIRQITAHLSYALTGCITCSSVAGMKFVDRYRYHFANQFFGYVGLEPDVSARQIRAIMELDNLALDSVSLKEDYDLFVKRDYGNFPGEISELLGVLDTRLSLAPKRSNWTQIQILHRRSIRRFHLLFARVDEKGFDQILGDIYSPQYPVYLRAISTPLGLWEKKKLQSLVFAALYAMFVGMPPMGQKEIPLTVRRSDLVTQYVQLLHGKVPFEDLSVQQLTVRDELDEDAVRYSLVLSFKPINESFRLTYPLLDYFWRLENGAVSTVSSPSLSHGIDRLKARLFEFYGDLNTADTSTIHLLLQTSKGSKRVQCEVAEGCLIIQ